MSDARDPPNALLGAQAPRIDQVAIAGTSLYAEVRGNGPAVVLIPGGAEDAEGSRPVAERLSNYAVVTYDRRGTLRSGRGAGPAPARRSTPMTRRPCFARSGSTTSSPSAAARAASSRSSWPCVIPGSSAGCSPTSPAT